MITDPGTGWTHQVGTGQRNSSISSVVRTLVRPRKCVILPVTCAAAPPLSGRKVTGKYKRDLAIKALKVSKPEVLFSPPVAAAFRDLKPG